jgi:predicted nucleic acid-binding protein
MRDGIRLHTRIFTPRGVTASLPLLLTRTPYGVAGAAGTFAGSYAELAARFATHEQLDSEIAELDVVLQRMPKPALFLAGRAFERYRRSSGTRIGVLPDFFIGAHAQVVQWPLLTRDVGRYRAYFPDVELITPTHRT